MRTPHCRIALLWCVFLAWIPPIDIARGATPLLQLRATSTSHPVRWQIIGPADNQGFYVQASTNLNSWVPIHWGRMRSGLEDFTDIEARVFTRRFYRVMLNESPIQVISGSTKSAPPFSLMRLSGSGFDPTNDLSVRFFDGRGFSVELPVVEATGTHLTVPVPVYVRSDTGLIGSNAVSWQIISRSPEETSLSQTFSDLQIGSLPSLAVAPGAVLSSLLKATVNLATDHLKAVSGSAWDTPAVKNALSTQIRTLTDLIDQVQRLATSPGQTFSLGSIGGKNLLVDQNHLRAVDQLLVGWLLAQSGEITAPLAKASWVPHQNNGISEAAAYAQAAIQGSGDLDARATSFLAAQQRMVSSTPDAVQTALQVVGGAGAVGIGLVLLFAPAEAAFAAVALPTAALLYITVESGGGMIALGGALGQSTDAAKKLVQSGVENLEDLSYGAVKAVLPQTAGAVAAISLGAKALKEAFTSTLIPDDSEPAAEIYAGTATYRSEQTSPQSPGWTPNPYTITTAATYPVILRLSAPLQTPGAFTGVLAELEHEEQTVFPDSILRNPNGRDIVASGWTERWRKPEWTIDLVGTGDASRPTIRIHPDEVWDDAYVLTATITVQPVTGAATLVLHYEGSRLLGDITIQDTIHYTLTRQ